MADTYSAGTITFNQKGQVLLIKVQSPVTKQIYWTIPKGLIEKGESPISAAERETYEETGIKVKVIKLLETIDLFRFYEGKRHIKNVYVFLAECDEQCNPKPDSKEVLDAKFVDFDKALIALKLHDKEYISPLLKGLWEFYKRHRDLYKIG